MDNIYRMELEIYEAEGCPGHTAGEKFRFPDDMGQICPWLVDAASGMIKVLTFGGSLPWRYRNTPYEKVIDPEGVTTEYIRCPDPTTPVVLKIIRTKIGEFGPDGQPIYFEQA